MDTCSETWLRWSWESHSHWCLTRTVKKRFVSFIERWNSEQDVKEREREREKLWFDFLIQDVYSQSLFDSMARSVYRVLEQREQYHHYLNYLQLRQLSLPHSEEGRGVSSPTTDLSSQSLPIQL